ncbi:MAG: hypothetical protein HQM08_20350 [Candidatus Riflebacteria bacterium]|nr:hypothetical protein [Candidatus Riflebacteria bacterium]
MQDFIFSEVRTFFIPIYFFIVRAAIEPGCRLLVENVGINPTNWNFAKYLAEWELKLGQLNTLVITGNPLGNIEVGGSILRPVKIDPDELPGLMDEIPKLALAMASASGISQVSGAAQLRIKESDRISVIVRELGKLGVKIKEKPDGFIIEGPTKLRAPEISFPNEDHRIAMTFAITGTISEGLKTISDSKKISISYPEFFINLEKLYPQSH